MSEQKGRDIDCKHSCLNTDFKDQGLAYLWLATEGYI